MPLSSPRLTLFLGPGRSVNYGSEALDTVEHLGLIIKDQKKAAALLQHFGSIANLGRASVQDLLPFLSTRQGRVARQFSALGRGRLARGTLTAPDRYPLGGSRTLLRDALSLSRIVAHCASQHEAGAHQGGFRQPGDPERSAGSPAGSLQTGDRLQRLRFHHGAQSS
jgi:hypothetical protein